MLLLKDPLAPDNIWAIWIGAPDANSVYLPAFQDHFGVTIGTSRSFILDTYGYDYVARFSTDSTIFYYNCTTAGIGFGPGYW